MLSGRSSPVTYQSVPCTIHLHFGGLDDHSNITLHHSFRYLSFNLILFRMLRLSMTKKIIMFILTVLLLLCWMHIYFIKTINQHQELKCEHSHGKRKGTIGNLEARKNKYNCQILKYANRSLPVTALASVQGSGNTWVRHLLQEATGI